MQRKLELVDFTCFYEFCTYLLGAAGALLESDVVKTRPNNTRAYKVSEHCYYSCFQKAHKCIGRMVLEGPCLDYLAIYRG